MKNIESSQVAPGYDRELMRILALTCPESVGLMYHTGEVPVVPALAVGETTQPQAEQKTQDVIDWAVDYPEFSQPKTI